MASPDHSSRLRPSLKLPEDPSPAEGSTVDPSSLAILTKAELHDKYVPPVDEPLFLALASDTDFTSATSLATLCSTLEALSLDALTLEASSNATSPPTLPADASPDSETNAPTSTTDPTFTNPTTSSSAGSDDPESVLGCMFPTLGAARLQDALLSNGYDLDLAIDELLNLTFLDAEPAEDRTLHILAADSAFATGLQKRSPRPSKKRRQKLRRRGASTLSTTASDGESRTSSNAWVRGQDDIAFLSDHTLLPHRKLTSLYHAHNANLTSTILALAAEQPAQPADPADVPLPILSPCLEIQSEYPNLPLSQIVQLFSLANQSEPSTLALAARLAKNLLPTAPLHATYKPIHPALSPRKRLSIPAHHHTPTAANPPLQTLDLHGLTAAEALPLVSTAVNTWYAAAQREKGRGLDGKLFQSAEWRNLEIVTGRGNHSKDHRAVLGPRVARLLVREGWRIRIAGDGGSLEVVGRARGR